MKERKDEEKDRNKNGTRLIKRKQIIKYESLRKEKKYIVKKKKQKRRQNRKQRNT